MIQVRKSQERGHADLGWLNSYHTFSFGDYYDPKLMGFRDLRVINEDRVEPGQGFGTHPHRDMEIISYVLEGALEHKDSMGTGSVISAGDVQVMSAGAGVTHSEYNPSYKDKAHFLQIWILPGQKGLNPAYQQKTFSSNDKKGKLCLIASGKPREGALKVNQDVNVFASILKAGDRLEHPLTPSRFVWVQIVRGSAKIKGKLLAQGDGMALGGQKIIDLSTDNEAELLMFDLV